MFGTKLVVLKKISNYEMNRNKADMKQQTSVVTVS
jgi:hypothetical protein